MSSDDLLNQQLDKGVVFRGIMPILPLAQVLHCKKVQGISTGRGGSERPAQSYDVVKKRHFKIEEAGK